LIDTIRYNRNRLLKPIWFSVLGLKEGNYLLLTLNPAKPTAKVIKFQTKKPSASKFSVAKKTQNSAAETIPFDDDNDGRGKVGTTDGF
jgi:hypothetical protein